MRIKHTFTSLKAFVWAKGDWRACPHRACRWRKRCTGGPRGTMRRFGKPLCRMREGDKFSTKE